MEQRYREINDKDGESTSRNVKRKTTIINYPVFAANPSALCQEDPESSGHEYEVFLSFMGNDTRKKFTDHLYHRMIDAGISVFKDNVNLPDGKEIRRSLSEAINKSKMAMPILSANYATSSWCLEELVCMLDCMNTRKQMVLPIFYDVTPSQVRHQTGSYAAAFEEHVKNHDEETVQKWRIALAEVTALKGLELVKETAGHEGLLTKMIVGKVLIELKKAHLRVTDKLVQNNDQEETVMKLLDMSLLSKEDAASKVIGVGLWGMGGIGKTTLAKHIYNQVLYQFDSCSFLNDIRETSSVHNGLARLQSQLMSDLSKQKCRDFRNVDVGIQELKKMFRQKKVLILLDDADHLGQLKALAGNLDWFGPGSRIIITTRDRRILDKLFIDISQKNRWACYGVEEMNQNISLQLFCMHEMNQKIALQLFCMHAFRQVTPKDGFDDLSRDIVETTGGLPLALEVIGSSLSGETRSIWVDTLKELRRMPKEEVQERLMISYKRLNEDQKQMFLDVACLFIGEDIDVVMNVWKNRDFSAEIGKDILLAMSLIKIGDENNIWMHDQLRDLGREIVRKENYRNPEKRSRLWRADETRDSLDKCIGHGSSSEVEALILHGDHGNCITNEQLRNFSNIWFLKLYPELAGDFKHLLPNLRWLGWHCTGQSHSPTNLALKKLIVLDMSFSSIREDWQIWNTFQSAEKLKVINLSNCTELRTLDVSMFVTLDRLILDRCYSLKEIAFTQLPESLVSLSMEFCRSIKRLSMGSLPNLQRLSLANCQSIEELPDSIGNLKALIELDLSGTTFQTLPTSIGNLKSLQVLNTRGSGICCVPDAIRNLKALHIEADFNSSIFGINFTTNPHTWNICPCVYIERLNSLDELEAMQDIQSFQCLSEGGFLRVKCIKVEPCRAFVKFPVPSSLKFLRQLSFTECYHLQEVEGLGQLEALEELQLSNCRMIQKLPNLSGLKSLRILDCSGCESLQELEGLDRLKALEKLDLSWCTKIEKLPNFSGLKSLKILNLYMCQSLQELEGIHLLEALEQVNLCQSRTVKKLPKLSGSIKSLKVLNFYECQSPKELPGLDLLEALEKLVVSRCKNIEKLPNLSGLKSLKILDCSECDSLEELEGLDRLETLEELDLSHCTRIEKLPNLCGLKSLKRLSCYQCHSLQEIEGLDQLEALKSVNISGCKAIRHLPVVPKQIKSSFLFMQVILESENFREIHQLKDFCSICQLGYQDIKWIFDDQLNLLPWFRPSGKQF